MAIILGILYFQKENDDREYLSRYEWAKLVCDCFGFVLSEDDSVYYRDVTKEDAYLVYVNTLYRAKVLPEAKKFRGNENIKKDDAINMIRLLLRETSANTLSNSETYIYADLLPGEKYLTGGTALELIEKIRELYFTDAWWGEDYVNIRYINDVVQLNEVIYVSENYEIIQANQREYAPGMKVVFPDRYGEYMIAGVIESIGSTNNGMVELFLKKIDVQEVIEEYEIKQTQTWGFNELYDYYKKHGLIIEVSGK